MFDTYGKYGLEEDGIFAQPDIDAESLAAFIKQELDDDSGQEFLPSPAAAQPQSSKSSEKQDVVPMLPSAGSRSPISNIPFNIPDVLPGRGTGYTQALKELLNGFSKKYV